MIVLVLLVRHLGHVGARMPGHPVPTPEQTLGPLDGGLGPHKTVDPAELLQVGRFDGAEVEVEATRGAAWWEGFGVDVREWSAAFL